MANESKKHTKKTSVSAVDTSIFGATPPQNIEMERNLLGCLMIDPKSADDIVSIVHRDDFYLEAHQILYDRIVQMYNTGHQVDIPLLVEDLRSDNLLDKIGGEAYLVEILHSVAIATHARSYAEVVREKSILRSLIQTSSEILQEAYTSSSNANDLINQAEERIFALKGDETKSDKLDFVKVLQDTLDQINETMLKGAAPGLLTGLADLDKMTGGMHQGELIILAARPSMGKTALAANFADYIAVVEGKGVLFVSLEMNQIELVKRLISSRGEIDGSKFRTGSFAPEDKDVILKAVGQLSGSNMVIDDSPVRTVTEIAALARRLKRAGKLDIIIIDYLQLIQPDNPNDPRQEQVSKIARRLKGMARELDVPVICLSQLNRQAETTKDNRPRMSHLRESGAIEQDADVVMFVHREEYYMSPEDREKNPDVIGKAEIILAKQRNGAVGDVEVLWRPQYTKFVNKYTQRVGDFDSYSGGV